MRKKTFNIFLNNPRLIALMIAVLLAPTAVMLMPRADAAALSFTYVRMDRMKAATAGGIRVVFKTSVASQTTVAKVKLKLVNYYNDTTQADTNKRFTVNASQAVSVATCAGESGTTALPTATSLAASGDNSFTADASAPFDTPGPTGKTITVTGVASAASNTSYCFDLTGSAITNPVTGGPYTATVSTTTAADVVVDTTDVGLRIVADDQIVVSAVVPPSFNLVLDGNTDAFTTVLDPSQPVSTGGRTATITTNAAHGWITWVKGKGNAGSAGLYSANAPYLIPSGGAVDGTPTTLSPTGGVEAYVLDVDLTTDAAAGGTVTIAPEYNGTTTQMGGTLDALVYQPVASADGTAQGDVITLIERATISASTPAGNDYTDVLTVIAAGNF